MTTSQVSAPRFPSHIPSLDGLRGISIFLVILGHAGSTHLAPAFLDHPMITSLGNVGVRLFFIISGFLITTLLLRDIDRFGRIKLKVFYVRRAIRIFPAVYLYIAIIWLLYLLGFFDLTYKLGSQQYASSAIPSLMYAISFTQNYNHDYNWYFNHLWSLAVEEQFYLLWPFALFALGVSRGLKILVAVVCLAPPVRFVMSMQGPVYEIALTREFQAVADALAMGCILAILHNRLDANRRYQTWLKFGGVPFAVLMIAIGYGLAFKSKTLALVIGVSFANIGMSVLLHHAVLNPGSIAGKIYNWKPLTLLGVISYSLYLWQQPFLFFRSDYWICAFPQNVILALVCGFASYWCVERTFAAVKERWTKALT